MSKRWIGVIAVGTALALTAAACGGDDDAADGGSGDGDSAVALPTCLTVADLYALTGPESEGFSSWADATPIAGELGSTTELPDAPLEIHGPGEESGTYDSYVEFAIKGIAEERGLSEEEIATRRDYNSSPNDNVIVEGVSATEGTLGWVGHAYFEENADSLRAFEIDAGEGCVAPTNDTIASGEYPFSRDLFIYVNTEKAAENPALARWVYDYVSEDGYAQVADAGYVQLTPEAWDETVAAWEATGIEDPGAGQTGSVVVSGSSTVEPISARVSENVFQPDNPDAAWEVTGPGTSDGFERFCAGETDVSDASRPIADDEAQACADAGVEYVELTVGIDGLTVFTSA